MRCESACSPNRLGAYCGDLLVCCDHRPSRLAWALSSGIGGWLSDSPHVAFYILRAMRTAACRVRALPRSIGRPAPIILHTGQCWCWLCEDGGSCESLRWRSCSPAVRSSRSPASWPSAPSHLASSASTHNFGRLRGVSVAHVLGLCLLLILFTLLLMSSFHPSSLPSLSILPIVFLALNTPMFSFRPSLCASKLSSLVFF